MGSISSGGRVRRSSALGKGLLPLAALAVGVASLLPVTTWAQQGAPIKIGVLTDASGPSAQNSGVGGQISAELAVADFGGSVLGRPITLLKGDHQAKTDLGVSLARQWYDEDVKAIFDVGITTVALGVQQLAKDKNKIVVYNSTGTVDLTGKLCSPNGIHWTYDSYSAAVGTARANMKTGKEKVFFMTVDYAFGHSLQAEATGFIEASGGTVVGSARHPLVTTDFSSDLVRAQASGADIIMLTTATIPIATIVKQANEFQITGKNQRLAPTALWMNDVKAIGLEVGQGLLTIEPYYWDQNDETRAFARRYRERTGSMPNSLQASIYGAVTHYLKAVKAANSDQTEAVLKAMRELPINDFMTRDGRIRADGRVLRDMYAFRIKAPAQSKNEWDLLEQVAVIPASEAFKKPDPACSLVK